MNRSQISRKTIANAVRWWLTERAVRRLERAGYTVHVGHCADWVDVFPASPPRLLHLLHGTSDGDGAA